MGKKQKKEKPLWIKKAEFAVLKAVVTLIEKLSLKQAYALARFAGSTVYYLDFKHRNRAVTHILHSGIRTTLPEAKKLAKLNFQHMVKVFVEIIKFPQIVTPENYKEYISFEQDDKGVADYLSYDRECTPVILASAHIGNWELAGTAFSMVTRNPLCSIMRPLENELIGNFFYSRRGTNGHTTVSKEKGLRPLLTALNSHQSIAIVSDQHASSKEGVEVTFCGHPARAHMTPSLLHLKTGVPILCTVLIRLDDDFHFKLTGNGPLIFTPTGNKEADIKAVTQLYTELIEKTLRQYPDQWLWAHRRWLDCNRKYHPKEEKQNEKTAV